MKRIFCAVLVLGCFCALAQAQEKEDTFIGLGVLMASSPYENVDGQFLPVPLVSWKKERFFIRGIQAGYDIIQDETLRASAIVGARFMGYDDEDSRALNGMESRDRSADVGLQVVWDLPAYENMRATVTAVTDAMARHQGHEVVASISQTFNHAYFRFIPSVGVKWQSSNLVNYYYGVESAEAIAGRSEYKPTASINPYTSAQFYVGVSRSRNWILATSVGVELLGSEITESDIIADSYIVSGSIGLIRRF